MYALVMTLLAFMCGIVHVTAISSIALVQAQMTMTVPSFIITCTLGIVYHHTMMAIILIHNKCACMLYDDMIRYDNRSCPIYNGSW